MTIAEKLQLIARNVQKVFDSGRKAERDEFWEVYLNSGKRTTYDYGFYRWGADIFYPNHNIECVANPTFAFAYLNNPKTTEFDLSLRLKECNVILDVSRVTTGLNYMFFYANTESIPELDAKGCTTFANTFAYSSVKTIEKLILNNSGNQTFQNTFLNTTYLRDIEIEGSIGNNIDFKSCINLSTESLRSILKALSTNGSGKAITFATASQAIIESDTECIQYATAAKSAGWTIAYNS